MGKRSLAHSVWDCSLARSRLALNGVARRRSPARVVSGIAALSPLVENAVLSVLSLRALCSWPFGKGVACLTMVVTCGVDKRVFSKWKRVAGL